MKVHCVVPQGTVLCWNFPAKLPASPIVHNAFMYTSVLQAKEASVAVHMHVRVCSFEELQAKFWMVEVLASGDQALHLRLVPASRQAIPTCTVLALKQYGEILSVEFVPAQRIFTSPLLFARRHMRAAREASRRAACV